MNLIRQPDIERGEAPAIAAFAVPETGRKIGYLMSRFPKVSETFVLNEILEQQSLGNAVEVYPLLREPASLLHPGAERILAAAHFQPFLSLAIVAANLRFLRSRPAAYLQMVAEVLRGTFGNLNFFIGGIGILPKSVWFAHHMARTGVAHIHAHFATHPALAALIIHRLTGIPFSFTAHGHDIHIDCRMLDRKLAAAAFAVTVSRYNKELMVRYCGEQAAGKIHVVHCGVDTELFRPRTAPRAAGPFRILSVGSLQEVKGHRYLIEACAALRQRGVVCECHVIGDGPLRSELTERIAGAELQDRFYLHGARPQPYVRRLLADADAFVLASTPTPSGLREGVPVALMEAMSCGLPVVSTRISGIPELIDSGASGLLVPPGDPAALADALFRLTRSEPLRTRLGIAARNKVMREFSLRANTARLAGLFASADVSAALPRGQDC